jgi:uncharacterized OsmC-like protein
MSTEAPADRLSALQERMRREPELGALVMRTEVTLEGEGLRCDAPLRSHVVSADEPRSVGGENSAPNPVELAVGALATCQAITYRVWANTLGIRMERVRVEVEGDFNSRGFLGVDDGVPPGLAAVRMRVEVEGPESAERYQELADAVDRHCPVLDVLSRPVPVERTLETVA